MTLPGRSATRPRPRPLDDHDDAEWIAQRMVLDAGAQAARVRRQASRSAATIREAAEREAQTVWQQASQSAAAVREASELEAAQVRALVMKLSATPDLLVAAPAAAPATKPAARPRTKPARGPQGLPRQLVAARVAAAAAAALFLVALVAGTTEVALHGFAFFVFRSSGTGETGRGPGGLQENQGPGQPDAPKPTPSLVTVRPGAHATLTGNGG